MGLYILILKFLWKSKYKVVPVVFHMKPVNLTLTESRITL